jgi:hypothetical protein
MKTKALKKLKEEINKDIKIAVSLGKLCDISELLYFLYIIHGSRLIHHADNARNFSAESIKITQSMVNEIVKYIASLIIKYQQFPPILK